MDSWEPVDVDLDGTEDEEYEWNDDVMKNLESRFEELRQYNKKFNDSRYKDVREETSIFIDSTRHDIEELVANEICDKLTVLLNNTRKKFGIQKGRPIDPLRKYDNFKLADDGELAYVYKRTVIDLGNMNDRLKAPWEICKLGVAKLRLMGFTNIIDEDVQPHRAKYKKARKKLRKLDENLDKRSKAIPSSSTTDAEAIEMIEMTFKGIDTTVNDVEHDTPLLNLMTETSYYHSEN